MKGVLILVVEYINMALLKAKDVLFGEVSLFQGACPHRGFHCIYLRMGFNSSKLAFVDCDLSLQ